jgi:hypothetical protein
MLKGEVLSFVLKRGIVKRVARFDSPTQWLAPGVSMTNIIATKAAHAHRWQATKIQSFKAKSIGPAGNQIVRTAVKNEGYREKVVVLHSWKLPRLPSFVESADGDRISLFASRVDGTCRADQAGGDAQRDPCNRGPSVRGEGRIGLPYRIDEAEPRRDTAGQRDRKYLDVSKVREETHRHSLSALCVELVSA